jgi:hypothetical protein
MSGRTWRAFCTICLLFLIPAVQSGLIPTYANICTKNTYINQEDCAAYNIAFVIIWHFGEWLNYYGGSVTAIATAVIGYFTYTLWEANRAQLEHASEVERAYVSGGGMKGTDQRVLAPLAPGFQVNAVAQPPTIINVLNGMFDVHINNHGKTRAALEYIEIGWCDASNPPLPITFGDRIPFTDYIGPGTQSRVLTRVPFQYVYINPAIYGRFHYRDIWENPRYSTWILRLDWPEGQLGGIPIDAPAPYNECT